MAEKLQGLADCCICHDTAALAAWREVLSATSPKNSSDPKYSIGYVEIYWVLEDDLGRLLGDSEKWDRGIRWLLGSEDLMSTEHFTRWLTSLVHYCFLADTRTDRVLYDIRADHTRYLSWFSIF